jgi:hypothetical protein
VCIPLPATAAHGAKRPFIRKTASGAISRQMAFKQTIEADIPGSAGVVKGGSAPPLLLADTLYVLRRRATGSRSALTGIPAAGLTPGCRRSIRPQGQGEGDQPASERPILAASSITADYGLKAIDNHIILTERSINSGSANTGLRTCPVVYDLEIYLY